MRRIKAGTSKCHGSPLGADEVAAMRKALNWNYDPFEVPEEILSAWRSAARRNAETYAKWQEKAQAAGKNLMITLMTACRLIGINILRLWKKKLFPSKQKLPPAKPLSCAWSRLCLMCRRLSAVRLTAASNLTFVDGMKTVTADDYNGNNIIMYGIRRHAMGAIMNGLALHGGVIPYGGILCLF